MKFHRTIPAVFLVLFLFCEAVLGFAPQDIKLERASYRKVTISWQAPDTTTQIANYRIYRNDAEIATTSSLFYTDENVQPGVTYLYKIIATTVGGGDSDFSTELSVKTLTQAPIPNSQTVEAVVDSFHHTTAINLSAVSLFAGVKSGMEAILGSNISFSVIDEEIVTGVIVEELAFISSVAPELNEAERLIAQSELNDLMDSAFSGNSFDHMFINLKLTELGDKHWQAGNETAAKLFYEFSLNYLSNDEATVYQTLARMAYFSKFHLSSGSSSSAIASALTEAKNHQLRFLDFFPNPSNQIYAKSTFSSPLHWYFSYFPKMLEYSTYDALFFSSALNLAQQLVTLDIDDGKSTAMLEKIAAWELINLQVRFLDENGNPRSGTIKIINESTANGKRYLFPNEIFTDERQFALSNGLATIPVYAGHDYSASISINVPGGENLTFDILEFKYDKNRVYSYDYIADASSNGLSSQSRVDIVVPSTSYPYNLRVDRGIDVFDLSWDWKSPTNFTTAGFKVFRGNMLVATTTSATVRLPLDNALAEYTYKVVAIDSNNVQSAFSRSITVLPGDQSDYSDFFVWMTLHFGTQEIYSYDDPDGDGDDNYHEFLNGTDPTKVPAPTPYPGSRGFNELTLQWNEVNSEPSAEYQVSRDGVVIGTSATIKFTDTNLIPGTSYAYKVRLIAPTATATDWSLPNTLSTQRAHNYPNADKVQQVVDTFVKMDILSYTGTNLVSAVKSAMEAVTGSNITFTVIDRNLLDTMVEQELTFLNEISPSMTTAERIIARNELDQMMVENWAGNSFEEMYINTKLTELAEAHWTDYLGNRTKQSSRTATFELYEASLLFLTNHKNTVVNSLNRMAAMAIQELNENSSDAAIKTALNQSRDTILRFYDYFPASTGTISNPYRKIIGDYWKYFPRLLAYSNYDQPLFNNVQQLATTHYNQDITDSNRRKLLNKIDAWKLTQLTINSNGVTGTMTVKNVSSRLKESVWSSDESVDDIREFNLAGVNITIPIYAGHLYEIALRIPVAGGEEWVYVIDNVTFGSNLKITSDPFTGQTTQNLPGNTGDSVLELTPYQVTFPYNLRAVKYPDVFNLEWEYVPQTGQSITGYNVYRGSNLISTVQSKSCLNIPREIYEDGVYLYSVSAVDAAGFESSKSPALLMLPEFTAEELRYFEWKRKYFGDAPSQSTDDPDNDGLTNYQEFLLGSNPLISAADFDADSISGKIIGAKINYYQLDGTAMPDFGSKIPYKSEVRSNFCFTPTSNEILGSDKADKVALTASGFFDVPADSEYSFVIKADDGIRLLINGTVVNEHIQLDSPREKIKIVRLKAGVNSFQVQYFNFQNNAELQIFWGNRGGSMNNFSSDAIWHLEEESPELIEYIASRKDNDGDGLSDFEETILGTDLFNSDSDGDGLSDYDEVKVYFTDPLNKDTNGNGVSDGEEVKLNGGNVNLDNVSFDLLHEINGSDYISSTGEWQNIVNAAQSVSRRGALLYNVTLDNGGICKFEFIISSVFNTGNTNAFDFYIDGKYISTATAGIGEAEKFIGTLSPYLEAGTHQVMMVWDNHLPGEALMVNKLKVHAVKNSVNNSGENESSIENVVLNQRNQIESSVRSRFSPYCLTGTSAYPEFIKVDGEDVKVYSRNKWFQNITLNSNQITSTSVAIENGGLQKNVEIEWIATDIIEETGKTFTVRKGDAMLLTASVTDAANWSISGTNINLSGANENSSVQVFGQTGEFNLLANCTNSIGTVIASGNITVKVVDYQFNRDNVICMVNYGREWITLQNSDSVLLKTDDRYAAAFVESAVSGGKYIKVFTDDNKARYNYAAVESDDHEIVLDVQQTQGVDVFSSNFTGIRQVDSSDELIIDDDMKVYNMVIVASPVRSDMELRLNIFVAGVTFEDGTVSKNITSTDFDASGVCSVNFIRPVEVGTSICHTMQAYQNNEYIGIRQR